MVEYHKLILILAVVSLLGLTCFGSALAMPEYAKRYKLACTFCHSKVPLLNEFGVSFLKDNPTPLEMKLPPKAGINMPSQGDEDPAGNKDGGKPGNAPGVSAYDNITGGRSTKRVEPPPASPVYRRVATDGTQIFTDNPSGDRLTQKLQKPGADTNKSVAARKDKRPIKQIKVQPPVPAKRLDIIAQPRVSAVRYRSYEECMEKTLLSQVKPANANEAMKSFVGAEETCRQFSNAR